MTGADPREILGRPARPPDQVLRYAEHADGLVDVYLPAATPQDPSAAGRDLVLLILFHGGFWQQAYDRTHLRPLAAALADDGYLVALPEFRRMRTPGSAWPGIFDDVAAVVDQAANLIAAADARPVATRAVLVGHSAGGHLALWAAARYRLPPGARWAPDPLRTTAPVGPIDLCGVLALAPVADLGAAADLRLEHDAVVRLLGGSPTEVPERYAAADPARLVPLGVPVEVLHGSADDQVPLSVSQSFVEASQRAGDRTILTVLEGIEHFALIDPCSPAWPAVSSSLTRLSRL